MKNCLIVDNLTFSYSKECEVFKNFSFEVSSNNTNALVGANGAGKTTLLYCICRLLHFDSGKILLNGEIIEKKKKEIYFIDRENDLIEYLTIAENIFFILDFYGKTYSKQNVNNYLKRYELYDKANLFLSECSAGMVKKVQIIISLLVVPTLYLADEPDSVLDEPSKIKYIEDLKKLKEEKDSIILISSHDSYITDALDIKIKVDGK
ncbi:MAG: ABC transporter ATP-binding protein [Balneola sp.]